MIDFPNSPSVGQIFNSGTGPVYVWDGVAWTIAGPPTGGTEELIASLDMAGLAFRDITGLDGFRELSCTLNGTISSTATPYARVSVDNGLNFRSGASDYGIAALLQSNTTVAGSGAVGSSLMALYSGAADANLMETDFRMTNLNKPTATMYMSRGAYFGGAVFRQDFAYGYANGALVYNAIRVGVNAGTFTNGFLTVKGIRG